MSICHLDKTEHIKNNSRDLKILKKILEIFKITDIGVVKIYKKKYKIYETETIICKCMFWN